ncbi:MAG: aromatic amino acid lyase, partial [Rubrivivax sp.]
MRVLEPGTLTLADLRRLHRGGEAIAIAESAWPAVERAAAVVQRAAAGDAAVYGVNTGFGKLASTRIAEADLAHLQRQLIRSHSVGVGPPMAPAVVRLILALKATSLARGASGVRREVIEALVVAHNAGLVPWIPQQGSVGASGDLAPLAHLTLALMGEGECWVDGQRVPAVQALAEAGLTPLTLAAKEGLALINGT